MTPVFEDADEARRRLERRLHDGPQQRVVALALTLRLARSRLDQDPESARATLDEALADLGRTGEELRDLARALYPAVLDERGLEAALRGLADRAPGDVEVVEVPSERLPPAVEAAAYWAVAAAVEGADRARVRVGKEGGRAVVEVGERAGAIAEPGAELRHAAARVEALGGSLAVSDDGATVRAEVPVEARS